MQVEDQTLDDLLARLEMLPKAVRAGEVRPAGGAVAETRPETARAAVRSAAPASVAVPPAAAPEASAGEPLSDFAPTAPKSLDETGVTEALVESLIFKLLLRRRAMAGRAIGDHLGLTLPVVEPLLARLKTDQYVVYRNSAAMGDYYYQLTEKGVAAAQRRSPKGAISAACRCRSTTIWPPSRPKASSCIPPGWPTSSPRSPTWTWSRCCSISSARP